MNLSNSLRVLCSSVFFQLLPLCLSPPPPPLLSLPFSIALLPRLSPLYCNKDYCLPSLLAHLFSAAVVLVYFLLAPSSSAAHRIFPNFCPCSCLSVHCLEVLLFALNLPLPASSLAHHD